MRLPPRPPLPPPSVTLPCTLRRRPPSAVPKAPPAAPPLRQTWQPPAVADSRESGGQRGVCLPGLSLFPPTTFVILPRHPVSKSKHSHHEVPSGYTPLPFAMSPDRSKGHFCKKASTRVTVAAAGTPASHGLRARPPFRTPGPRGCVPPRPSPSRRPLRPDGLFSRPPSPLASASCWTQSWRRGGSHPNPGRSPHVSIRTS